jgi:hypothetical protein
MRRVRPSTINRINPLRLIVGYGVVRALAAIVY